MSYDEYWLGPAELTRAYREAHRLKTEAKNHELWWQGFYFHQALMAFGESAFTKHRGEYPKEPYRVTPLTEEEKRQKAEENRKKVISYLDSKADAWSKQNG